MLRFHLVLLLFTSENRMYWNSFSDFLDMGGYAFYVWGAFLMTFLIMALEIWLTCRQSARIRQRLVRQLGISMSGLASRSAAPQTANASANVPEGSPAAPPPHTTGNPA
jgi:heme exporter protein D